MSSQTAVGFYQQAEAFKAQGLLAEAAAAYRSALEHDPHALPLWWALGDVYAQMENFPGVEDCCRQVIARDPRIAEAHLYLGMALQRQGRMEQAESALLQALGINPGLAEGRYQLAIVQQSLGNAPAAIENYRQVLPSLQDAAPALYNLSLLCLKEGLVQQAYDYASAAIQAAPGSLKYRQQFVRLLHEICPAEVPAGIVAEILHCFDTPGLDTAPLMKPGVRLLAAEPAFLRAVQSARRATADEFALFASRGELAPLVGSPLLHRLLLHTKITSPEFEALLCALRRLALDDAMHGADQNAPRVTGMHARFIEALACQFFNTEYAAFVTADEQAAVDSLAAELVHTRPVWKPDDQAFIRRLAVVCMYRPLSALDADGAGLQNVVDRLQVFLPFVVKRQWTEPRTERALRDQIGSLTPIGSDVSAAVRAQYEESPYPRWFSVDIYTPVSYRESLRAQLPGFEPPDFGPAPIDILVAGCGTGRHAIMLASHLADSRLLAVDLSKSSLAYAKRKAGEAGLGNIQFAQADILNLGTLGRRFHIIESVGVLHHLQEPRTGLGILADMLVEGGLMRLGLYSTLARRAITAARQYIAAQGFESSPAGIRAARRALLALDADHPAFPATHSADFYSLSECRDLLFHVQEHCLRIPDLQRMLDDCGLKFIGFSFTDSRVAELYKKRYPDDPAMRNLANWDAFEQAYPDTFAEMYQFWCQKA